MRFDKRQGSSYKSIFVSNQQDTNKMRNTPKPNISVLQTEIESKLSTGYLFAIAAKVRNLGHNPLSQADFMINPSSENNSSTNKIKQNGNTD